MDVLISGLVLGCIYALVALGFTFTWMTTLTLNFGQGSLLMLGALLGVTLHVTWGLPMAVTALIVLVVVAIISVAVYWGAIAPFNKGQDTIGWILATVAVDITFRSVATMIWGKTVLASPPFFGDDLIEFGQWAVQTQQIVIGVGLILIVVLLTLFVYGSLWGRALTAVAQNRMAAALSGVSPAVIASLGFALSGALSAAAGLMIAPVVFASTNMGVPLLVKAFTVSVLGGLSSIWGTVFAGLLFGICEALVARYLGSQYRDIFGLLLLVLVLAYRPTGLFGLKQVVKV
ncbi:MAG: branched-chain amino acid ABC transporter permease [Janthinobacterium lividum]